MNISKKELIISVLLILAFLVVGINTSVLATSGTLDPSQMINVLKGNNVANNNIPQIPVNNNTNNEAQNIPANNTTNNTNTNTPGKVPDTGLEDAPWLIIGVCAISAVFAYKKIKEYRID